MNKIRGYGKPECQNFSYFLHPPSTECLTSYFAFIYVDFTAVLGSDLGERVVELAFEQSVVWRDGSICKLARTSSPFLMTLHILSNNEKLQHWSYLLCLVANLDLIWCFPLCQCQKLCTVSVFVTRPVDFEIMYTFFFNGGWKEICCSFSLTFFFHFYRFTWQNTFLPRASVI